MIIISFAFPHRMDATDVGWHGMVGWCRRTDGRTDGRLVGWPGWDETEEREGNTIENVCE